MKSNQIRLEYLDSLRGLAAYIVVIGHFFPDGRIKNLPFLNLISDTKLAVAIFFVLSGVVLTNPKYNFNMNAVWLPVQLIARFFRLMIPVFAVTIFVWLLYSFDLMYFGSLPANYEYWEVYNLNYQENVDFARAMYFAWVEAFFLYDPSTSLIPPAWTMRPELFGSVVILIYVWFLQKGLIRVYPIYLIFLSFILVFTYGYIPFIYYFGFFFLGSALRHLHDQGMSELSNPVLIFTIVLLTKTTFESIGLDSFQIDFIFASLIVYLLIQAKSLHNFMIRPKLIWLAKVSFPLYLLHVPLISSFGLYTMSYFGEINIDSSYGQFIIFILLSIVLFIISRLFLPFENLGIKLSRNIRSYSIKK